SQSALAERRSAKAGGARPGAFDRHQMPVARRTLRGNCAGAFGTAVGGPCLTKGHGSDLADGAIRHESLPRTGRRGIQNRARGQRIVWWILTFASVSPQVFEANVKSKTTLESDIC